MIYVPYRLILPGHLHPADSRGGHHSTGSGAARSVLRRLRQGDHGVRDRVQHWGCVLPATGVIMLCLLYIDIISVLYYDNNHVLLWSIVFFNSWLVCTMTSASARAICGQTCTCFSRCSCFSSPWGSNCCLHGQRVTARTRRSVSCAGRPAERLVSSSY
jgi:hypothetical protein